MLELLCVNVFEALKTKISKYLQRNSKYYVSLSPNVKLGDCEDKFELDALIFRVLVAPDGVALLIKLSVFM